MMRSLKSRGGLTRSRGVTESIRTMWINIMNRCAEVHNDMYNLTGLQHTSSDQHVELKMGRERSDYQDIEKFGVWVKAHDTFNTANPCLRCLSSGLTNCYRRRWHKLRRC